MAPFTIAKIRNTSGVTQAVLTGSGTGSGNNGYLSLAWRKKRNGIDVAKIRVRLSNPDAQYLVQDKYVLELRRADPANSIAEYTSFTGLLRDYAMYTDVRGNSYLEATAFGANHLLDWRHCLWYADYNNRSSFVNLPAETIAKTLVTYNCAASATAANGRQRDGAITGFTVHADAATGITTSLACAGDNILTTLQKLQLGSGGDFAVVMLTPTTYEFRWYNGQLGTNRSATLTFSVENDNMVEPRLVRENSRERTVAVVYGVDQGVKRQYRTRTGTNYNASTNNLETVLDARQTPDQATLDAKGDQLLAALRAQPIVTYKVRQSAQYRVERDYFLGDKVTAFYAGTTTIQFIDAISFSCEPGVDELVDVETTLI